MVGRGQLEGLRRRTATARTPQAVARMPSIATVGILQPILDEELASGQRRLVAGERRLRARAAEAAHHPDNPHFAAIEAHHPPAGLGGVRVPGGASPRSGGARPPATPWSGRHDGPAGAPGRAISQRYVELDDCTVVKARALWRVFEVVAVKPHPSARAS
ncbi:MAG TPA: ParB N-terminal domain-containing protein [Acidimicrobiales bacterium]|nr:ParB N-terminal domain-containing protein [Acidimicrobiales bacterium]